MWRLVIRLALLSLILLASAQSAIAQNYALQFDGVDDFVEIPHHSSFDWNQEMTIECWVRSPAVDYGTIFNKWQTGVEDKHLRFSATGEVFCYLYNVVAPGVWPVSENIVENDRWYHIASSSNADSLFIYLNGVRDTAHAVTGGSIGNSTNPAFIGVNRLRSLPSVDLEIDELRVWDVFKTPQEVREMMFQEATGSEPGLVAAWHFNEGSGQVAYDVSPNGNHGDLGSTGGTDTDDPAWVISDAPIGMNPLDFGLVGYWSFDDGTATDNSGYGNDGTVYGAVPTTGVSGQALSFDGVDDWVQVPHAEILSPTVGLSISAWVKPAGFYEGSCQGNDIVNKGVEAIDPGAYVLRYADMDDCGVVSPGLQRFGFALTDFDGTWQPGVSSTSRVQLGRWHHLVATYEGISMRMFVDGVEEDVYAVTKELGGSTADLTIGRMLHEESPYWVNGIIDEVRIYERALSSTEILDLYNGTPHPSFCDGSTADFCDDFEEGLDPDWEQRGDCTWEAVAGIARASITGVNVGCGLSVGDGSWTDYQFEFDVRGNTGYNKAISFREQLEQQHFYGLNLRSNWMGLNELILHKHLPGGTAEILAQIEFPSENGIWYRCSIQCEGSHITVVINGQEVINIEDTNAPYLYGGLGLQCISSTGEETDISFDNVVVTLLEPPPLDPPDLEPVLDAATGDMLVVRWSHPDPELVEYYVVSIDDGSVVDEIVVDELGDGSHTQVLDGLDEQRYYVVSIEAFGQVGSSGQVNSDAVRPSVPVFLVHGLFDNSSSWATLESRLETQGFGYVHAVGGLEPCGVADPEETHFSGNAEILSNYIEVTMAAIEYMIDVPGLHLVDVDLIGHSMGGLICRRYISETASTWGMGNQGRHARKLIMLGTPNKGSSRAFQKRFLNIFQRAKSSKCGPNPGPALKELAVRRMRDFNKEYPDDPTVSYYSVWGSRGPNPDCYNRVAAVGLHLPHDGAVSRNSAVRDTKSVTFEPHYINHYGDEPQGWPESDWWCHSATGNAAHNYLEDEVLFTNHLYSTLTDLPSQSIKQTIPDTEPDTPPQLTFTLVDTLDVGQSSSGTFYAEPNISFLAVLIATDSLMAFSLESPSGFPYDSNLTSSDDSEVYENDRFGMLGYYLESAEAGVWQWTIDATNATTTPVYCGVVGQVENDIVVIGAQSAEEITADESLTLNILVTDGGAGVVSLTVGAAQVYNGVDTVSYVDFFDDGLNSDGEANDGTYGAVIETFADTGMVEYLVSISGTASVGQIDRQHYMYAFVEGSACCTERVGDANNSGSDEPTIGDVAHLVDHLFIDKPPLVCVAEADINQSGGATPSQEQPGSDITIGDVADLVDYLFITGPAEGVLPDCL